MQAALVLSAIDEFDLEVSQIYYDITTVELYGAYETDAEQPPPSPLPAYGHTKSGRKNVKQIQQGLSLSVDGGVPLCQTALDGNTNETGTHRANLEKLDQVIGKYDFLYVAETKLDTKENLLNIAARKGKFLCGGASQPHWKDQFLKLRRNLCKIDYCSTFSYELSKPKGKYCLTYSVDSTAMTAKRSWGSSPIAGHRKLVHRKMTLAGSSARRSSTCRTRYHGWIIQTTGQSVYRRQAV